MSTALTRLSWRSLTHEQPTACFSETHRCVFRRVASFTARWNDGIGCSNGFSCLWFESCLLASNCCALWNEIHSNFDYTSFLVDIRTLVMINKVLCFSGISIFFDISRLLEWWCGGIWKIRSEFCSDTAYSCR